MKNIIFIPFAQECSATSGQNIRNQGKRLDIYFKNICVALFSAKRHNQCDEVALVTNLKDEEIPLVYRSFLTEINVSIIWVPFDAFRFDASYKWMLAFYKLCALKHISQKNYENICYLDADVWIQGSFEDIWSECSQKILLYDINHGLNVPNYRKICDEFSNYLGEVHFITHFGGEFFAANKGDAQAFINSAEKIYFQMQEKDIRTTKGDEYILSLAANECIQRVKNAGAYVWRFWTGCFYMTSTRYQYNPVVVLHVPSEKERGMILLWEKYVRKRVMPKNGIVFRILHLRHRSIRTILTQFWNFLINHDA